jgi:hypothetical protein
MSFAAPVTHSTKAKFSITPQAVRLGAFCLVRKSGAAAVPKVSSDDLMFKMQGQKTLYFHGVFNIQLAGMIKAKGDSLKQKPLTKGSL